MKESHLRFTTQVFLILFFAGLWSTANAQIEEIVVTAQKREQSVQDVGIAITAFSGEQIESLGIQDSVEIALFTPGVSVSASWGGQMSQFSIRGVTQNDYNDHVEAPSAVYIDEGYVAMQQGQMFSLFDIERVELLKGPQGTLFGRNATGGLIHFISRKPTEELDGYVDLTYGDYEQIRFEAAISGPLTDNVSGRLSVMSNTSDAYVINKYPGETFVLDQTVLNNDPTDPAALNSVGDGSDMGADDTWALRGQLLFDLSDRTELRLIGFGTKTESSFSAYQSVPTIATLDANGEQIGSRLATANDTCEIIGSDGSCVDTNMDGDTDGLRPVPGADYWGYRDPDGNDFVTSSDFTVDDLVFFETYGATAILVSELDRFTFSSITDYKDYENFKGVDLDEGPVNQLAYIQWAEASQFSQEFRLSGSNDTLSWVAGFYYLDIDNIGSGGLTGFPNNVAGFGSFDEPREVSLQTQSSSVFGQVDYDLSDTLRVIGGLRVTREEKDFDLNVGFVFGAPVNFEVEPLVTPLLSFSDSSSDTLVTAKLQLEWTPNEDMLVYAGINRGVKAGSYNSGGSTADPAVLPYDEEVLTAYEVGFKSTIMDGRARLNGAVFYYDYADYQAARFENFANTIINRDAVNVGGELEFIASPTDTIDLVLSAGYFDAEVKNVPITSTLTRNTSPTFAPDTTLSALFRYTLPAEVFGGSLALQGDVNHQSETYHNIINFEASRMDGFTLGNVRASWTSGDEAWQLDAFVKNVTDKRYNNVGFEFSQLCGCNEVSQGKPRWWGVSARYSFQ